MDFGSILEQWDKMESDKAIKQKANKSIQTSNKKANAPLKVYKSDEEENYSNANDIQKAWLLRYGTFDKDKFADEEEARALEHSDVYLKNLPIEARLDLHNLTSDESFDRLNIFIDDCTKRGLKKVLIIHGKGIHSNGSDPVLGKVVRTFIEQNKHCGRSGHPDRRMGGNGATWILLK